jgi:hypothetical protein
MINKQFKILFQSIKICEGLKYNLNLFFTDISDKLVGKLPTQIERKWSLHFRFYFIISFIKKNQLKIFLKSIMESEEVK